MEVKGESCGEKRCAELHNGIYYYCDDCFDLRKEEDFECKN